MSFPEIVYQLKKIDQKQNANTIDIIANDLKKCSGERSEEKKLKCRKYIAILRTLSDIHRSCNKDDCDSMNDMIWEKSYKLLK